MFTSLFGKKKPFQVHITPNGPHFSVPGGQTILEAAQHAGIGIPYDCKVGSCGACKYRLIAGKVTELSPSALALSKDLLDQGYRLACQCLPKSDLQIALDRIESGGMAVETFQGVITQITPLTHDIVRLQIRLDRLLHYRAGQYADLLVKDVPGARSYSFAAAPLADGNQQVEFHVRAVPGGAFTGWLFAQDRTGAELTLTAPQGSFGLNAQDTPILCIGGGSGLAPLKAVLEQALKKTCQRPVTLLYGARTIADLYCLEEIEAMRRVWPVRFDFIPVLSNESSSSDWKGARGLVADFAPQVQDLALSQAYLCGPPPMVDAAEAILLSNGMPQASIFADRFYDRSRLAAG